MKKQINNLSLEARGLFNKIAKEWRIRDDAGKFLLRTACECFDRLREAQEIVRREGILITDRWGQQKAHPATQIEKEARAHLLACFKSLNLDIESLGK